MQAVEHVSTAPEAPKVLGLGVHHLGERFCGREAPPKPASRTARRRCIFRCGAPTESCSSASARLAGVVAEDESAAALATQIHYLALGRGRELLKHFAVEALVIYPEPGGAQAPLEFCTEAAHTIRFHRVESSEGTTTLGLGPLER